MTSPPRILASALKRFSEEDILWVLAHPAGAEADFPRDEIISIGGFTKQGLPIVVMFDMETDAVFHAQKSERKYHGLFGHGSG